MRRAAGIVVAPFAVPPALAQQGVTDEVVAAQMLDRLTAMQAETLSIRPASSYGDDWSGNIKVALPDGQLAVPARISGAPERRYDAAGVDTLASAARGARRGRARQSPGARSYRLRD